MTDQHVCSLCGTIHVGSTVGELSDDVCLDCREQGLLTEIDWIVFTWADQLIVEYRDNPDWTYNDLNLHVRLAIKRALREVQKKWLS